MKKFAAGESSDLPKLSAPAQRAIKGAGISNLKDLTKITEAELLQLHGMGPSAATTLKKAMNENGLSFRK